ncbi:Triacylglycerol esterase/lipase EstA, alpha/beta hydrolase fold [Haloechinothrix alba]|uniref:Triacylglycerol esterase/lipase EstA, alpha/beta hydrolase fold n=1 Tax=Haloechinothrix alba TaxID=664784 RepID=A0A238YX34_9PSEU|nr:Triacylglycerol esterase/lipase EstA, alpha/beta hydrolase fold [Haloechinothrix alba]
MASRVLRRGVTAAVVVSALGVLLAGQVQAAPSASPPPDSTPYPSIDPSDEPLPERTIPDERFAPVDKPGPALEVPTDKLEAALQCTGNTAESSRGVVLFVPGTTVTPRDNFSWNWFPAMDKLGRPYCSVTLPNNAMSDAQVSAEYVVHAIRTIHRISGQKVDVLGHSQGGTEPRFALRFWPDLRPMVDDYIAFGATNHGSLSVNALCPPVVGCAPALWQQTLNSGYIQAMNSRQETFPGISYTNIYTRTDEFVQPNLDDSGTSSLHGGGGDITNVALQDICPADVANEHIAVGTYAPSAYALAMDALDHEGPAQPERIDRTVCGQVFMPGVNPLQFASNYTATASTIAQQLTLAPRVTTEPELKPYTLAD